jgi:ribonucleoside-diphosphate reductase alpha chain
VAYIARLLIHRYAMHGLLDEHGFPVKGLGLFNMEPPRESEAGNVTNLKLAGKACVECGQSAVIKRDGCDFCTACGHIGACG